MSERTTPDNRKESLPHDHADVSANMSPAKFVLKEIRSRRLSWRLCKAGKLPIDYVADAKELWILYDERIGAPPDIGKVKDEQQARRALRLMEQAAIKSAGDAIVANAEANDDLNKPERLKDLQAAYRKAFYSLQYAETKVGNRLQDPEAYNWLKEHGLPEDDPTYGELAGYHLPTFDTWARYLRVARNALGEQKYHRRGQVPKNVRSIVRSDEIETQHNEDD